MHPENDLALYALGTLTPEEGERVEEHVSTCASCREELRRHQEVVERMVEELPAAPSPVGVRASLLRRARDGAEAGGGIGDGAEAATPNPASAASSGRSERARMDRPRSRVPIPRAVGVIVAVVVLVAAGLTVRSVRAEARVESERRTVAAWLSRPEVVHVPLRNRSGTSAGGVLLLPDGRALFVLREAAASGREYQAWGHAGEDLVSLTSTSRPVFEVDVRGYDAVYLSSEPRGGSPEPTESLGRAGL